MGGIVRDFILQRQKSQSQEEKLNLEDDEERDLVYSIKGSLEDG